MIGALCTATGKNSADKLNVMKKKTNWRTREHQKSRFSWKRGKRWNSVFAQ